jgi:hypothetical protein
VVPAVLIVRGIDSEDDRGSAVSENDLVIGRDSYFPVEVHLAGLYNIPTVRATGKDRFRD